MPLLDADGLRTGDDAVEPVANTSTVAEMANLISVMRSYEANQRLVQMQDDRMGKAISELGTPS